MFELSIRDLVWFGSLLVSMSLAYARLKSEIRHLDDTKSERREVNRLGEELRGRLSDILTSLARMEESLRHRPPDKITSQ